MPGQKPDQAGMEIVPAQPRALQSMRRWPAPRTVALSVAAGAVGSIFLKRLVELGAEDAYRHGKNIVRRLLRRSAPSQQIDIPSSEVPPPIFEAPTGEPVAVVISYTRIARLTVPLRALIVHRQVIARQVEVPLDDPPIDPA